MEAAVNEIVEKFRPGLQADGSDVLLTGIHASNVYLTLTVSPETCLDCLLPKETLQSIFESAIGDAVGHPVKVFLDDPRTA